MNSTVEVIASNFVMDEQLLRLTGVDPNDVNKWMVRQHDKVRNLVTLISFEFRVYLPQIGEAQRYRLIDQGFIEDLRKQESLPSGAALWVTHANHREVLERIILEIQAIVPSAEWRGQVIDEVIRVEPPRVSDRLYSKALAALMFCQKSGEPITSDELAQVKLTHEDTMEMLSIYKHEKAHGRASKVRDILGPCYDEIIQIFEGVRP